MDSQKEVKYMPEKGISKTPAFAEGPFVVKLRTPGTHEGAVETSGKWVLGGSAGAKERLSKALMDVNELPDGLGWDDLREKANEIFASHDLLRVDF